MPEILEFRETLNFIYFLSKKAGVFIACCFIIFPLRCFAQNEKIDALFRTLPALKDTSRIDCLNELGAAYATTTRKDSAEYYTNLAFREAEKLNYNHGIAEAFCNKSKIAKHYDDDFIGSETFGKESLFWFQRSLNKKGLGDLYVNLWYTAFAQSKFDEALGYIEESYLIAKRHSDTANMFESLHGKFATYRQLGNYEKSLFYLHQAHEIALKANNKFWISDGLYGTAQLYALIENYPEALNYFRQVLRIDDKDIESRRVNRDYDFWMKMEFAEVFSHLHQFDSAWHYYRIFEQDKKSIYYRVYLVSTGECYLLQRNYRKALQNLLQGAELHKKLNDRNEVMRALLDIGKIYLLLSNDRAALQYGKEGLAIAMQTQARQFVRDGYYILYSVYNDLHNTDSAYYYYKQYIAAKDKVLNEQMKGQLAAYKYEQMLDLINKEVQISQQQLMIQRQRLAQEAFNKKILLGGMIGLFILSAVIFRLILLKRKYEKHLREIAENDLHIQKLESQKQLVQLEMQTLRAQMNPHFIFNSLNSINLFILENNKRQASEYLTKFSRLIRLILQNSLNPFVLLEKELEALHLYLILETVRFENKFSYEIIVQEGLDTARFSIPPLLIQPYVENAIWHGLMYKKERGHLKIELYSDARILYCKIADDGIGRKKAAELKNKSALMHKSMGMNITAQRLEMLQNQSQERSVFIHDLVLPDGTPGGTEVILKIPISDD